MRKTRLLSLLVVAWLLLPGAAAPEDMSVERPPIVVPQCVHVPKWTLEKAARTVIDARLKVQAFKGSTVIAPPYTADYVVYDQSPRYDGVSEVEEGTVVTLFCEAPGSGPEPDEPSISWIEKLILAIILILLVLLALLIGMTAKIKAAIEEIKKKLES